KEYTILEIKEAKNIDSEEVVRFVVDRLETLIEHTKHVKPILTSENMAEFEMFEEDINLESPKEQIYQTLEEAEKKIYRLSMSKEEQMELILVIQYLIRELDDMNTRRFIIKSLLLYLKDMEGFKYLVKSLETILKSVNV